MTLVKRWENHINISATFVDDDTVDIGADPYPSPQDNIPNGMYDLSLHLA